MARTKTDTEKVDFVKNIKFKPSEIPIIADYADKADLSFSAFVRLAVKEKIARIKKQK